MICRASNNDMIFDLQAVDLPRSYRVRLNF